MKRYWIGFMLVLVGLATLPLSASAQAGEEHSPSFWHDEALKIVLFSSSSEAYKYPLELELEELAQFDFPPEAESLVLKPIDQEYPHHKQREPDR